MVRSVPGGPEARQAAHVCHQSPPVRQWWWLLRPGSITKTSHAELLLTRRVATQVALLKDAMTKAGLPLYLAPYGVLPTAYECGIIEVRRAHVIPCNTCMPGMSTHAPWHTRSGRSEAHWPLWLVPCHRWGSSTNGQERARPPCGPQ